MKIRLSGLTAALAALTVALVGGGCRSTAYYQNQAVESARQFLLAERPQMPFYSQEYVKFNRPFFLMAPITGDGRTQLKQICITWMVPGEKDLYLIYGTSTESMEHWSPERVICKRFELKYNTLYALAQKTQNDVLQNYYGMLTTREVNHIRFTLPAVWKTRFPLELDPQREFTEAQLKAAARNTQFAMVWELYDKAGEYMIVGGVAKEDFTGFRPYFTGIFSQAEFDAHKIEQLPVYTTAPDAEK